MFVRWQRKRRSDLNREWGSLWCAVLVESRRVEGSPRQRTIAYLGSIREGLIGTVTQRGYFWRSVTEGLDRLANRITPDERAKFEASIAVKVPVFTAKDRAEANKVLAKFGRDALF